MEAKHRAMHLTFSIEDRNGNDVTCPSEHSPDSMRSSSSLSCGSSDSPPDVEMEDCISDATSRGSLKTREPISNATFVCPKKEETSSSKIVVKSSGAINVDFVKSKIDNWNENMALLIANPKNSVVGGTECSESGGDETCGRSSDASPDCREGELSEMESCEPSRRGSSENCCSVSSGEMVMRGNSFILHETDQPLSISLLGESKTSLDISSDLAVISGMLPDVCEGICEDRPAETPHGRPKGLERTFHIQSNNQTIIIEGDLFPMPLSSSDPQKETEDKDLQLSTDKCLTPIHHHSSNKDFQKLCNTGGSNQSTPVEGKTVLLTASEDLDISGDAQTSTPVQSVSNKTFHLPPLSESPLNKDEGDSVSPMAQVINRQRVATSQKAKMPLMAASKSSKIEIKRFPKPNFSNIKSKIMSRPTNPFKTSRVSIPKSSSSSTSQDNENQTTDQSAQLKSFPTTSVSSTVINNSAAPAESTRSSNVAKRTRSSTFQESGPAPKSRPRRWSESGSLSKTSKDGSQEQNLQVNGGLTCETPRTLSKRDSQSQGGKTKPVDGRESSKEDSQGNESPRNRGKNPKVSLLAVSGRTTTTTAAACEWSRGRLGPQPSPARTGGASAAHVPAANLRQTLSATSKLKPGTGGKDGLNTTDVPTARSKLGTPDVKLKIHPTDGTSAVSGGAQSRPLAAPPTSASKLLLKPKILPKSSSSSSQTSGHPKQDHSVPPAAASGKTPSCRAALFRNKLQGQPARALSSGCKNTSGQSSARPSRSPLKTPTSARPSRPAGTLTVDKNKSRATFRNQQPPTNGHPDLVPPESKSRSVEYYKALCEKKNQTIQQLENAVRANNRRFEAVAVVIKHFYSEHEEVMKQRRDISQELVTLREELVNSAQSCERLEQQKDELRAAFDGVLQKVQEQHRLDLAELEERLKTFYSTEWEKVHHTYQEEADKCRAQMEQQLEELQSKHEALKKEIEVSHLDEVQRLKQQFEESFKEFQQSHEEEMLTFNTSMKESEETLSSQIQELITENNILKEKLKAEERRRSDLADKSQKDCHTLYLEQELESLKVVLDIKNKQIHEQDKKLMQIDKLMERNVKLDECLKKVQQENEDLKARMDKHAALSRQLSTEQAVLQESLQKESKVNKRLSMENEELLWKLHNGDLSSPRKISPSPSLTLQSPRNSGMFSSPPVSPR